MKKFALAGLLVLGGSLMVAPASAEEKTWCEENGRRNGPLTETIHELHEDTEDVSPQASALLHDAEKNSCQ